MKGISLKLFPIGVIIRSDGDHKVLAVDDSLVGNIADLSDVSDDRMKPVVGFLERFIRYWR